MRRVAPEGRQPEQLIDVEGETDDRQLGGDGTPHLPNRKSKELDENGEDEVARGDLLPCLLPEGFVFRVPMRNRVA
jgi:hypothetical protein